MSEMFKVRQHAGPGARFGPDAFRAMTGGTVPVTLPDEQVVEGTLRTVFVPDGGAYADLVIEVPDGTLPPAALRALSIGPGAEALSVSNYTKPERPGGVPRWIYLGAEHVNGTGQTLMWVEDDRCEDAGGDTECCTGEAHCQVKYMSWQEMSAIGMWMIAQADVARDAQLREG